MSETRIVVLQRGWVVIGSGYRVDYGRLKLDKAAVIRRWGTTKGLGELRAGPTSKTVVDPIGALEAPELGELLSIHVDAEAWAAHL